MKVTKVYCSRQYQAALVDTAENGVFEFAVPFELKDIIAFLHNAENAADFQPQLDRLLTAKRLFDEGYALLKELR